MTNELPDNGPERGPNIQASLVRQYVNRHPNGTTENDEVDVLTKLYGDPDNDGIFRGEGKDGE